MPLPKERELRPSEYGKASAFQVLCQQAHKCKLCPGVFHELTYLNMHNGRIDADLMFVGEAPGFVKNPKERGKTFHGNQSGYNFEKLLSMIGIDREDVFVTNALLHTPVQPSKVEYRDYGYVQIRSPSQQEKLNCSSFLRDQIVLVNPKIVVTLGRAALDSLNLIEQHQIFSLKYGVAKGHNWFGRILFPLYHTSPNVTANLRPFSKQLEDFKELRYLLNRLKLYQASSDNVPK